MSFAHGWESWRGGSRLVKAILKLSLAVIALSSAMASQGSTIFLVQYSNRQDSPDFDLVRTLQQAIGSSPTIAIAQKQVAIDSRRVDEAASDGRPQAGFNFTFNRYDARTIIPFGNLSVEALNNHLEILQVQLTQRLDFLGQIRASVNQARLQQAADEAALETQVESRTLRAKTLYFNLLRADHQVQVTQSAVRDAVNQESVARRLYENQVGQKIDLLRAETSTAQARQNLVSAQNDYDVAKAAFNDLVGRNLKLPVHLVDVPNVGVKDIPNPDAPVGTTPPNIALPPAGAFTVAQSELTDIDLDKSINEAQVRRPEVIQNSALARAQQVGVRIAREGTEPAFSLSLTGDEYPTPSLGYPRRYVGTLTLNIALPIYDGGKTADLVREAKLRTDQANITVASTKSDIALQVRQAYLNLQTAARQIDNANAALVEAIGARQLAQVRYEGQVGLFLEVTDAQAALVRAESDQVDAIYTYLTAKAQFENVLGVPPANQTNVLPTPPPVKPAVTP